MKSCFPSVLVHFFPHIGEAYIYNMAEYSGKRKLVGTAGSDSFTGTPHQVVLLEAYNMAYHSLSLSPSNSILYFDVNASGLWAYICPHEA